MNDKTYNFFKKVIALLENVSAQFLKAWLNTVVGQSFLKKFIDFAVDNLMDELIDPILKTVLVKIGYRTDVKDGQRLIVKLNEARESGDESNYNTTVDDILG
jgi:uncharacterized membrane protein YGL010W